MIQPTTRSARVLTTGATPDASVAIMACIPAPRIAVMIVMTTSDTSTSARIAPDCRPRSTRLASQPLQAASMSRSSAATDASRCARDSSSV
jgi:hypothetical protein